MFRRLTICLILVASLLAFASSARAQGCIMCNQNAQATDAKSQRAINKGIFALITPTLLMFGAVGIVAYRRRNSP